MACEPFRHTCDIDNSENNDLCWVGEKKNSIPKKKNKTRAIQSRHTLLDNYDVDTLRFSVLHFFWDNSLQWWWIFSFLAI